MNPEAMLRAISGTLCAAVFAAHAAVTPDEARRLGEDLTQVGAEQAGNKEGTIPRYSGGVAIPPEGFQRGGSVRPDLFAQEKPLFSIDAKNVDAYADRLSEGAKALLKAHPDFRIDVYPTHRTVAFPPAMLAATRRNATDARSTADGVGVAGARGGVPFPIPSTGSEVMLNHNLRYLGSAIEMPEFSTYFVDRSGAVRLMMKAYWLMDFPYNDGGRGSESWIYYRSRLSALYPPNMAGEGGLHHEPVNYADKDRRYWSYMPAQRRMRLAPHVAYDTPNGITGGISTMDDVYLFNGKMDRFEFKLVGKKELYVPYNANRFLYSDKPEEVFLPKFINPQVVRWELHRVWVVEATPRVGVSHIYSRRTFYVDEDSWHAVASDQYDAKGKLWRAGFAYLHQAYDAPAPVSITAGHYDLAAGAYYVNLWPGAAGVRMPATLLPDSAWTPDSRANQGIR